MTLSIIKRYLCLHEILIFSVHMLKNYFPNHQRKLFRFIRSSQVLQMLERKHDNLNHQSPVPNHMSDSLEYLQKL